MRVVPFERSTWGPTPPEPLGRSEALAGPLRPRCSAATPPSASGLRSRPCPTPLDAACRRDSARPVGAAAARIRPGDVASARPHHRRPGVPAADTRRRGLEWWARRSALGRRCGDPWRESSAAPREGRRLERCSSDARPGRRREARSRASVTPAYPCHGERQLRPARHTCASFNAGVTGLTTGRLLPRQAAAPRRGLSPVTGRG
jgi:hypothetical protein